jgi:transcriptional regulator with XRE-family HTH domain
MAAEFLRAAREARGLSLSEIAASTRISPTILQRLERGDFDGVPAGLYVRSYLKAYAAAVGLDPDETLRLLDPLLPRAVESFSVIVQTAVTRQPPAAVGDSSEAPPPEHAPARVARLPAPSASALKMSLEEAAPRTSRARLFGAAVVDALLLATVSTALVCLSALACGVSVLQLLRVAAPAMAVLCGTVALAYFGLLAGIAGRTCGAWLLDIKLVEPPPARPMDLSFVARRTAQCLVREASSLIGLRVWEPVMASADRAGRRVVRARRRTTGTLTPLPDRSRSA